MTTDTVPKMATSTVRDSAGSPKSGDTGSTTSDDARLLTTDAIVDPEFRIWPRACDITFSQVDSDTCMSTNDTVVAMASGGFRYQP